MSHVSIPSHFVYSPKNDGISYIPTKIASFSFSPPGDRAGAAMAMFLAGVPCETIQLIGRWRSRTSMKYLRIQVTASTRGVTTKMTSLDSFFTVTMSDDLDENYEETRLQKWPKPGRLARPRANKPGTQSAKQQGKAKDH